MNDEQMADKLVEKGILVRGPDVDRDMFTYVLRNTWNPVKLAEQIVNDWNVAGTCLERWPRNGLLHWKIVQPIDNYDASKGLICQNPRAICEAFAMGVEDES